MTTDPRTEYIYGINPAFEVVRAGRRRVQAAFLNQAAVGNPRLKKLSTFLQQKVVPVEWTDKGRLSQLSGTREHQGVLLLTSGYPYVAYGDLIGSSSRLLVPDNIEDPQNLGAILRSTEAFGFDGTLLPRRGVPGVLPSVVKASAGATEHLAIARNGATNQYVRTALAEEYCVVALDCGGDCSLEELSHVAHPKLMLVVGGENRGVGQFVLNSATHVVSIDQRGKVNSLNASAAAAIALFMLSR